MDKKRTVEDIQQEIEKLHNKAMDKRKELLSKIEDINFKIKILDKVYQEEKDRLYQQQVAIAENEVRKELEL